MTKAPTPTEKSKKQHDNTKTPPETSITQRFVKNLVYHGVRRHRRFFLNFSENYKSNR